MERKILVEKYLLDQCLVLLKFILSSIQNNGVKIIPNNIYELLTPIALAHLIMGDGSAKQYSLKICTDSYTVPDIIRLMNVLIIRYELDCTLRFHTPTQPRIHIKQNSMPKLRAIVGPYMCQSMMYKLGEAK